MCAGTDPSMLAGTLRLRESLQRRFFPLSVCSGRVGRVREEERERDLKDGFGMDERMRRGRERRIGGVLFTCPGPGTGADDADVGVSVGVVAGRRRERGWPMVEPRWDGDRNVWWVGQTTARMCRGCARRRGG